uniref:Uncharacterized protein n=1 Tax=Knipowitschia caucasica TaxID=637954 RepID=A0AAV2JUK8_KNICA
MRITRGVIYSLKSNLETRLNRIPGAGLRPARRSRSGRSSAGLAVVPWILHACHGFRARGGLRTPWSCDGGAVMTEGGARRRREAEKAIQRCTDVAATAANGENPATHLDIRDHMCPTTSSSSDPFVFAKTCPYFSSWKCDFTCERGLLSTLFQSLLRFLTTLRHVASVASVIPLCWSRRGGRAEGQVRPVCGPCEPSL